MFKRAYFKSLPFNLLLALMALGYTLVMSWLLFYRDRYFGTGYAYNLVPFDTIKRYIVHYDHFNFDIWFNNLFGNIVLFIPIGLFLPLLDKKYARLLPLAGATVLIIAAAELVQMLTKVGSFDIDDIILNTLGAMLGLAILRFLLK
ncbi:VanZ family protein [Paenibacillus sp. N4]|uniref:VanZ family protein n=1 Tax=Paenibacillus vietnamensis TaxID=2590547 RepID=UPI001CD11061|nr:VanZ family protein [Paenibacillus vietnamensis]MCA0756130.1 VanZ family protein [Paenibacillus vietnamensis]